MAMSLLIFFRSEAIVTIILSSLICFLFFSWSLYSQTFLSKYLGSTYVPLIPILGVGLALLFKPNLGVHSIALLFCTLYAVTRLGLLVNISQVPNFVNKLTHDPASLQLTQSPNLM